MSYTNSLCTLFDSCSSLTASKLTELRSSLTDSLPSSRRPPEALKEVQSAVAKSWRARCILCSTESVDQNVAGKVEVAGLEREVPSFKF